MPLSERRPMKSLAAGFQRIYMATEQCLEITLERVAMIGLLISLSATQAIAADGSTRVQLKAAEPSPIPASTEARRITLIGQGFVEGSRVTISRDGQVAALERSQIEVLDNRHLVITVIPGEGQSEWALQVSTPGNQYSNILRFRVEPKKGVARGQPSARAEEVAATTRHEDEAPNRNTATEMDSQQTVQPGKAEKGGRSPSTSKTVLMGYEWLAQQPGENFTIQLMASESSERLQWVAAQRQFKPPLAKFAMKHNGSRLYALTQGSYRDRASAERAAKTLPADINPWVRSMESVQKAMVQEEVSVAAPARPPAIRDVAWLWSQDPSHYTLQLAAGSNEQTLEQIMRQFSLPGEMMVLQVLHEGKDWYLLLYGSFATRDTAQNAVSILPAPLQEGRPWPRSFAGLQEALSRSFPEKQ